MEAARRAGQRAIVREAHICFLKQTIIPGDGNKHDPERENWPYRVMLPIQSISGSRLLPSPGIWGGAEVLFRLADLVSHADALLGAVYI